MDVTQIVRAVGEGIVSLPMDFYSALERTFQDLNLSDGGHRTQQRNFYDDERVFKAVSNLIKDRATISKVAELIINDVLSQLPDPALKKLHDVLICGATAFASRSALQIAISTFLGTKVLDGTMSTPVIRLTMRGLTGVMPVGLVTQGVIARACEASRRLSHENPRLWLVLRTHNYDMLYFMFEGPLKHFLAMGKLLRTDPNRTEDLLRAIENL